MLLRFLPCLKMRLSARMTSPLDCIQNSYFYKTSLGPTARGDGTDVYLQGGKQHLPRYYKIIYTTSILPFFIWQRYSLEGIDVNDVVMNGYPETGRRDQRCAQNAKAPTGTLLVERPNRGNPLISKHIDVLSFF